MYFANNFSIILFCFRTVSVIYLLCNYKTGADIFLVKLLRNGKLNRYKSIKKMWHDFFLNKTWVMAWFFNVRHWQLYDIYPLKILSSILIVVLVYALVKIVYFCIWLLSSKFVIEICITGLNKYIKCFELLSSRNNLCSICMPLSARNQCI